MDETLLLTITRRDVDKFYSFVILTSGRNNILKQIRTESYTYAWAGKFLREMKKLKTLVYVHDLNSCRRLYQIFNHDFNLVAADTREEFLHIAENKHVDVGILCYCYANEKDLNSLLEVKENVNHLPLIICSKIPNPDFISRGAQKGLEHFILCGMPRKKIRSRIQEVIKNDGLRVFIKNHVNTGVYSPYTTKIITEILHRTGQLQVTDLAETLGISTRWTQSLFRDIFGMTYTELMRRINIYQALNLMRSTHLDNTEIALKLSYSDENSLYRIFHKELGYSPTEARKKLLNNKPEDLLN